MTTSSVRNNVSSNTDALDNEIGPLRRGNALSNKLTSVLSSSYADTEIRDALRLLDARHGFTDLDSDFDLKHEAQKEAIEANAKIVDDFSKVVKQLDRVGRLIATLNQTCDDIRKHVHAARQETTPMLEDASILLAQKRETEQKQELLDSFCKHFLLSDEDLTILTSSAEPLNEQFFQILARVKQIHRDCELLLGYENQRLGLELMEQTTRNLNAGYKKLFNWTLREFKGLDLEDPHISGSIRRSLRALSERPALFQNCLDSFAEARESTVSDAFQKALTDSTMGAARAIEFSTHDPLRYIGDMLAWAHSAAVSEMEALEGLFISDADEISQGLHHGKTADPFSMPVEEGEEIPFNGREALNSLISRNMASVAHTLTQRISMTIRNLSDPIEAYKAYNVLCFYYDMFLKLIRHSTRPNSYAENSDENESSGNTLLSSLTTLQSQAFSHFQTITLETLHASVDESPATDLTPPAALQETLAAFTTISRTRGPALTLSEFTKLYTTLLAPVLTACNDLAGQASDLSNATAATSTIYKLNYMALVRDSLSVLTSGSSSGRPGNKANGIEAAHEPLRHAQSEITSLTSTLTKHLSEAFITSSGLAELEDLLTNTQSSRSATRRRRDLLRPAPSSAEHEDLPLEFLAQRLDTFLAGALMDAQDSLTDLVDKAISASVLKTAVEGFCEKFEELVGVLEDVDEGVEREALARRMGKRVDEDVGVVNGDEHESDGEKEDEDDGDIVSLREVYPRTVEEVRALLS